MARETGGHTKAPCLERAVKRSFSSGSRCPDVENIRVLAKPASVLATKSMLTPCFVLYFSPWLPGFLFMPETLTTVVYSSAKINECIEFVELNRMAFYSGQKPRSALSWTTTVLSHQQQTINHNSHSSVKFNRNRIVHIQTVSHILYIIWGEHYKKKSDKQIMILLQATDAQRWWLPAWYTQNARTMHSQGANGGLLAQTVGKRQL